MNSDDINQSLPSVQSQNNQSTVEDNTNTPPGVDSNNTKISKIGSKYASSSPNTPDTDLVADDVDLIEKEWVEKTKEIVKGTYGDPYKQNKELHKMRAKYVKQRYNKDIKVSE